MDGRFWTITDDGSSRAIVKTGTAITDDRRNNSHGWPLLDYPDAAMSASIHWFVEAAITEDRTG